ncbi:hypothetical protein RND71_021959 [Anisodus tanguticus]|uniref:IP5PC-F beta-propeller domain-containing protein n=1 Tax=Anisodus tanguticus TaxID=243964 RepID=A0AAE1RY03_9SOLA|nr:hypothetical protein RND71_021959 [Anisodus tanguticus]
MATRDGHMDTLEVLLGNCRNAQTRELLKVYNAEGQIENRADMSSMQEQATEDEMNSNLLVHWDGNGNRLQDFHHHPCAGLSLRAHGSRIWVGYVSGMVQMLDLEGNLLVGWVAHNGPIVKIVVGDNYLSSLATHGGIRGWSLASPGPIDNIIRPELAEKEHLYTRKGRVSQEALAAWLRSAISNVGIVVVGLQEVEMGAGFLAMSAGKETVGLEGSAMGQWWQHVIGKALDEGSTF